jgi:hypothetical protein
VQPPPPPSPVLHFSSSPPQQVRRRSRRTTTAQTQRLATTLIAEIPAEARLRVFSDHRSSKRAATPRRMRQDRSAGPDALLQDVGRPLEHPQLQASLLYIGTRPPPSPLLRPARPPERRKGGAGEHSAPLNLIHSRAVERRKSVSRLC